MNTSRTKTEKESKTKLSEKRAAAAKKKSKVENKRKKNPQKKSSKGFLVPLYRYVMDHIKIREKLSKAVYVKRAENSDFSTIDMIVGITGLIYLGMKRVYHAKEHQQETLLARELGLEKFPSDTTIYRFLEDASTATLIRQVDNATKKVIAPAFEKEKKIIMDGDWSTLRSYENQKQGAECGFNKLRPGQPCFQAISYFANGFCIRNEIVSGNGVPIKPISLVHDLKNARRICRRIDWLRLDAGFLGQDKLEDLDEFSCTGHSKEKIRYVVNVGMLAAGAKEAKRQSKSRPWISLGKGVKIQDHRLVQVYKNDKRLHRLILVRQYFKNKKGKKKWRYYALVTNELKMTFEQVYSFYHKRQTIEKFFDQAKNDFHIENLPCSKLLGNSLYFNLVCFSFNLIVFFRLDCLAQKHADLRFATLQRKFFFAFVLFNGTRLTILRSVPYFLTFVRILYRLQKLNIFLKYQIC